MSAPAQIDYSKATDGTKLVSLDPWLEPFAPALRERHSVYRKWVDTINATEGGLVKFSEGYRNFVSLSMPSSRPALSP